MKQYLYYHDNGACQLWDSKISFEEDFDMKESLSEEKYQAWLERHLIGEFDGTGAGYTPTIVEYLCEKLGIEVDSI